MSLKKVLVVDDSELVHKMHGLVLQRYHDCEILHTYNGNQALDMLHKNPDVQLILLDINMPVMDGLRFLETRNQMGVFTGIPVIIISTEGKENDTKRGMEAGATAYVTKPFRPAQLHAIIDNLFDEKSAPKKA
ncbi:MAG: response regulator [Thermoanaerobaculia bacterium]|jgi:two-component system, chemotaxis family, chemotaxis protein CheY